jgi:hypothetical protein
VRHVVYTPVTTKPPMGASGGVGTVGVEIIGPELPLTVRTTEDAGLEIERGCQVAMISHRMRTR